MMTFRNPQAGFFPAFMALFVGSFAVPVGSRPIFFSGDSDLKKAESLALLQRDGRVTG